jgi:hypothetical protein
VGVDGLPDWEAIRALLQRRPKPPATATVYALGKPVAKVVTDGRGAWWIDAGNERLLQGEPARALFVEAERLELILADTNVHTHLWAKQAFEPWGYELDRAKGAVVAREESAGREAIMVDVDGLKGSVTFRLWVDEETGIILRMERADEPAPILVLDDVRVGTVEGPHPNEDGA